MSAADHTAALIGRVHYDNAFQLACQRYHHHGGSSMAIARAALRALGLGDGAILLPAPEGASAQISETSTITGLVITGNDGCNEDFFIRSWVKPAGVEREEWLPAQWRQTSLRKGSDGNRWRSAETAYVMDDFGYLVPVGGAA